MADPSAWTPDPDQVAAIIPHRTGDPSGRALGSWSSVTVPTTAQVAEIIQEYVEIVSGSIGVIPDTAVNVANLVDLARRTVSMGAAAQIELSFYPDQSLSAQAPSDQLYSRYQDRLKSLIKAVSDANRGGALGGQDDVPSAGWEMPDPSPAGDGGIDPITWYTDF